MVHKQSKALGFYLFITFLGEPGKMNVPANLFWFHESICNFLGGGAKHKFFGLNFKIFKNIYTNHGFWVKLWCIFVLKPISFFFVCVFVSQKNIYIYIYISIFQIYSIQFFYPILLKKFLLKNIIFT